MSVILLASLPKSGTNLFRIALFNYLCHLRGDLEQKTYDDLIEAFPNEIKRYIDGVRRVPRASLLPSGYEDFIYGHAPNRVASLEGPVVGLYRNPRDFLVSAYYYFYVYRVKPPKVAHHPREIIDDKLPVFRRAYKPLRQLESDGRAILFSYEELYQNTADTIAKALQFLDLPVHQELASLAAQHASFKAVKSHENKVGFLHHGNRKRAPLTYTADAKFIRSGKIGQWQNYFTDDDVAEIDARLNAYGIDPADFTYAPA